MTKWPVQKLAQGTHVYTNKKKYRRLLNLFCYYINTLEQNKDNEQSSYLSEYDCRIALKEMKNNKIFWNDIKQFLV